MARKQISGYVDAEEKETFKAHANAADMSISEWVVEACREKVERQGLADQAQRYRIEQRLLTLVDDAAERAADQITDEILETLETDDVVTKQSNDTYDWGGNA
ncbi:MAG: hypothetical protein ABEI06_00460 [Halobacteriaceae archaeon]